MSSTRLTRPVVGPDDRRNVADIGKPVRDFWGRRTSFQKFGLVAGFVFIGLGISAYVGDGSQTTSSGSSRCVSVSPHVLDNIAHGIHQMPGSGGAEVTLSNGKAVHSDDFQQAYFVAARLEGPRIGSDQVGLWVVNDLYQPGLTFSVNDAAKLFSDWGDGGSTDAHFSTSDDGASEAEDCAR